jgi:predicted NUDIX family NTP pyrophosphohydrolase
MASFVEFADVQVLFDTGLSLVCLVEGMRVRVPTLLIQPGSEVWRNGDHGKLVIPKSLALSVGLA